MNSGVEAPGLKPRAVRAPGSGRLTPRCAVSGGWAEERQEAQRVQKCKRKTAFSVGQLGKYAACCTGGGIAGKGRGWRGRGPSLRAAAGGVSPGWQQGRVRVERPLQVLTCSPTDPPSPQSLTPTLCTQELLRLGEAFWWVTQVCGCCPEGGSSPGLDQAGQGSSPRGSGRRRGGMRSPGRLQGSQLGQAPPGTECRNATFPA